MAAKGKVKQAIKIRLETRARMQLIGGIMPKLYVMGTKDGKNISGSGTAFPPVCRLPEKWQAPSPKGRQIPTPAPPPAFALRAMAGKAERQRPSGPGFGRNSTRAIFPVFACHPDHGGKVSACETPPPLPQFAAPTDP